MYVYIYIYIICIYIDILIHDYIQAQTKEPGTECITPARAGAVPPPEDPVSPSNAAGEALAAHAQQAFMGLTLWCHQTWQNMAK